MKHAKLLLFLCALFICSCKPGAKDKEVHGRLVDAYCDCLQDTKSLADSLRIDSCDSRVLADSLYSMESDSAAQYFMEDVHVRLQKECKTYATLLDSLNKDEDWEKVDTSLQSALTGAQCEEFIKYRQLYYIEPTHDTTYVSIEGGTWTESLKHHKYFSKLSFRWTTDCNFELSFIQSNDPGKGKLSGKGEKYRYRILDKKDNYFLVLGIVKGAGLRFRVFY